MKKILPVRVSSSGPKYLGDCVAVQPISIVGWWRGLRQAEEFFAVGRDLRETPRGIEDDFDVGFTDAGQFEELALDLGGDLSGEGTALRCQRHLHVDTSIAGFRNGLET